MIRHGYKNSKRLSSFQCQLFRRIPSSFQRHQQSTQVDDTVNTSRGHTNSNTKSENDDTRGVKNDSEEMRKIPFYGQPRPDGWKYGEEYTKKGNSSLQNRIVLALHYATTAFVDPTRADAVAALGEITGSVSLRRIYQEMEADPIGRQILQDRPIVSKATIPYAELIANAPANENDIVTFGHAYGYFLRLHGFDPDERDEVKYIEDETLAYIMLRYRQVRLMLFIYYLFFPRKILLFFNMSLARYLPLSPQLVKWIRILTLYHFVLTFSHLPSPPPSHDVN